MESSDQQLEVIDFNEIKTSTDFELFTEDLLHSMGYQILVRPGVGADGGKDMIVAETMEGRYSRKTVKYLVSCKHLTTGKSVGTADEQDIRQRVEKYECHAFLAVYSTFASERLISDFNGVKAWSGNGQLFDIVTIDGTAIRKQLLELPDGPRLVRQHFPRAHIAYLRSTTESYIYRQRPVFRCTICKINILDDFKGSIVYEATHGPSTKINEYAKDGGRHCYHIHDIKPYCDEHTPEKWKLPMASMIVPIQSLITPRGYNRHFYDDMKFIYFHPPYLVSDGIYRKWNHLINGLFYFVARGGPKPSSETVRPLLQRFEFTWEL